MIDIEGIFDEEMEVINNIDNFNFDIPFIGGGWEYFHMNN